MKMTIVAILFLVASTARAETPDAARAVKVAVETVAAEVEVLVVDRNGAPVDGLTKDDFRLFVNGKETPLDWLEPPPAARATSVPASPAAATPAAGQPTPTRRPHSTIFIISALDVDVGAQKAGLDALAAYADRLPDGEEASVYLLDNGARRLVGFTSDRRELKKAIDRPRRILAASYLFERRTPEWIGRARQSFRNLGAVLDGLASRSEPKTVVVLAGPLSPTGVVKSIGDAVAQRQLQGGVDSKTSVSPIRPMDITQYRNPIASGGERQWNFLSEVKDIENQAFLARATIVALDPTGLVAPLQEIDVKTPEEKDLVAKDDSWEFRNDTFALIAESTGGARLGFSNRPVDLILDASRLLERRYRLGFTPPDGTSARRDIRVELTRPGFVLRTARGQRSLTAETAARARFAGLLLSADAPRGDFAIAVEMKSPTSKRTDDALPFDILVPVSAVYAEERDGSTWARLELLVSAVDDEGRASEPVVVPFSVELANATAVEGAFFRKGSTFRIDKRWKGRLFVGVRDTATSRLGAVAMVIGG